MPDRRRDDRTLERLDAIEARLATVERRLSWILGALAVVLVLTNVALGIAAALIMEAVRT